MLGRVTAFTAFVVVIAPALACSCVGIVKAGCEIPPADVIVLARVVSIRTSLSTPEPQAQRGSEFHRTNRVGVGDARPNARILGSVTVTLDVMEHFRGPWSNPLVIQTDISSCGYRFHEGLEYVVFATEFQGNLTVSTCSATQPSKAAPALIRQLRAMRDGTALPSLFGSVLTQPGQQGEDADAYIEPAAKLTVVAQSAEREYRTATADTGLYEFTDLPLGEYFVQVEPPVGRIVLWGGGVERVRAPAGVTPRCALNFQVFGDGRLSGTVTTRDGTPVSGTVVAEYIESGELPAVRIGGSVNAGRFELPRLWPGRYRLEFHRTDQAGSTPHLLPGDEFH